MQQTQSTPGSQTSLREANRARVVSAVQQHGALTQVELVSITGLSAASVSNIVTELSESGVLDTSPSIRSGRRARLVTLARSIGLVAGIDVGARAMQVTLADASMQTLATETLPLAADHRADLTLQRAAMLIEEMAESTGASPDELLAVGIGVPAPVRDGAVSSRSLLRGWDGAAVAEPLQAALRVPVVVDNDADLGALAEARYGAGVGKDPVVYVHASHALGAGIVIGGRVLHGRRGTAGEIGHVVVDENGPVCRCGNRGCLEAVAGAVPMLGLLRDSHGHLTLDDVVLRALDGDAGCRRAIADTGRSLGAAIATMCNLIDPEVVVIGGRLADSGGILLDPLREAVERHTLTSTLGAPEVVPGAFGAEAETRGAIASALDRARELGTLGVPS